MAKVALPLPTWSDYLAGRKALLALMTPAGRKAAGAAPPKPKTT